MDWYKIAVAASAVSAASSLNQSNQMQIENAHRAAMGEQRRTEIIQSRRILQNIGSFIDNIDNEDCNDESKLVALILGNSVLDGKGLATDAFDEMSDIRYASEIKVKYLERIRLLTESADSNIVSDLGNDFISSNFNIDNLGFIPTITRPLLLDISEHFRHHYLAQQCSIEIISTDYSSDRFLEARITDYGVEYSVIIEKSVRGRRMSYKLLDGGNFSVITESAKANNLVHEFYVTIGENREIRIHMFHDSDKSIWPSSIGITTHEGGKLAQNLPEYIPPSKEDIYCKIDGCKTLRFRNGLYCHKHK